VGIHAAGGGDLIAPHVLVFAAWGIGAHALTTITDRDEDAAAGVRTIAVLLGRRNTAIFSAAWFVLVGLGAASIASSPLAFAVALPYLSLSLIGRDATGEAGRRLYRLFLITNVLIGASITMLVLLQVPFESAVAAGAVAIVGTLIALGASVGRSALRSRRPA
jgi:4-hydroxybenzoate polyprenyltransferase